MFTTNHFIWGFICAVLICLAVFLLKKYQLSLNAVLTIACIICVLSELVKLFSNFKMVPSSDGTMMYPYIEQQYLPFHLCSLQIVFIFYSRFSREAKRKESLLAFMYPTCLIGAFLAILLPTIFSNSVDVTEAFTHPLAYQYFLYHTMLVILGMYIPLFGQVNIRSKHYFTTLGCLGVFSFVSFYLNSMFASTTYENGILKSVDYTTNFFYTYIPPIPIAITELWHWYLYIGVLLVLAIVLIGIFYLPYFVREKRSKKISELKKSA